MAERGERGRESEKADDDDDEEEEEDDDADDDGGLSESCFDAMADGTRATHPHALKPVPCSWLWWPSASSSATRTHSSQSLVLRVSRACACVVRVRCVARCVPWSGAECSGSKARSEPKRKCCITGYLPNSAACVH